MSNLRGRVLSGASFLLLGELYANLLRLLGNLILTRLLYPEAFGLMLIVNLIVSALELLSDAGIRGAIISKRDSVSNTFLDTAWTLMVVRGFALSIITALLAYPISQYYAEGQLRNLLLIASLGPAVAGFTSLTPIISEKHLQLGRVVAWRCIAPTVALGVTVFWMVVSPTVYALAANGVMAAATSVATSYLMFKGRSPVYSLDPNVVRQLILFGRWILIATALTFFARNGESVIVSTQISTDQLGIFSIAIGLTKVVTTIIGRMDVSLLFPLYSSINHDSGRFPAQLRKVKLGIYLICCPVILLFAGFGKDVIVLLYDVRYQDAGWMLEIMAAGLIFYAAGASLQALPLSHGDSFRHMILVSALVAALLLCMLIGGALFGLVGLIGGYAVSNLAFYPVLLVLVRKYSIGSVGIDLFAIFAMTMAVFIVWHIRGWPWAS